MKLKHILGVAKLQLDKNAPAILSGVAIAGTVGTVILAARGGAKANTILTDLARERLEESYADGQVFINDEINIPLKDKVKAVWTCYIPASLCAMATIGCIAGAHHINAQRLAAMASAYVLSKEALEDHIQKIREKFGDDKYDEMSAEMAHEYVQAHPINETQMILTGAGDHICIDKLSGRYFKTNIEKVRKAVNDLNEQIINMPDQFVSLNVLYSYLGLPEIRLGDKVGWTSEKLCEIKMESTIADNGEPVLLLNYYVEPRVDKYSRLDD